MSTRSVPARAGFTLVEVLLTLLIMSFILVGISEILTGARKTRDRIHNIQERQLAGPAILDRIESDLRALVTYDRDAGQVLRIKNRVLTGYDADTLDFVASTNSLAPWREHENEDFRRADFNEVGYRLRTNPTSDDFLEIYRREDFGIDDEPFDGGGFSLLHDRVKGLNIEIYTEDGVDAEPIESWSSEDDENVGLPTRIDIELTLELAPRLVREQLVIDRRTMVYRRVIRFPEILRRAIEIEPSPTVPDVQPPVAPDLAGGPAGGGGGGGRGNEDDGPEIQPQGGGGDGGGLEGLGGGGGER